MDGAGAHFVHEWHGVTTVHPLGLTMVLAMGLAMLAVPRRYAIWPMIVIACFVSPAQRIVILGADFNFLRIMVLFGMARLLLRNELRPLGWRGLDTAVVVWAAAHLLIGVIRVGPSILANKLGFSFDAVGMYLLFRVLIRNWEDVKQIILCFSLISVPVAAFFAVEWSTGRNLFSVLGGVPEMTVVRDGRLRCQGAFAQPILAGLFWASLLPLIASQWWRGTGRRYIGIIGVTMVLFIVIACASATPVTGVMFAGIGAAAFFVRYRMRWIRWSLLFIVIALHLVMIAPVWHLISRISIVGGNTGYHRYALIDNAIKHAHEWWLIGTSQGTDHWGWQMYDVTNYYVVQGLHGGLLLLALFIVVIALAFNDVGRTWRSVAADRKTLVLAWSLGVSLFVHVTGFLAISYFGQIIMIWYLLLAMIASMAAHAARSAAVAVPSQKRRRVYVDGPAAMGRAAACRSVVLQPSSMGGNGE